MKVLPKIKTLSIEKEDSDKLKVKINESAVVRYKLSENCEDKLDIAQDLVENRAFGTLFLFLNENFKVITDISTLVMFENVENFYRDCDRLLKENISVVEELGKPLTEIEGYPIFESDRGILRGSGKKKVKEYFKEFEEIDLEDLTVDFVKNHEYETMIKGMCMCPNCKTIFDREENTIEVRESGVEPYSTFDEPYNEKTVTYDVEYIECPNCKERELAEDFPDAYVSDLVDAVNAEELVPGINSLTEEVEGTQAADIADKTDYNLSITPAESKKKKHYDILLGNYNRNEIDESVSFKGFLKNSAGQYQRGNYILVKEGDRYLAVHKDKVLTESKIQFTTRDIQRYMKPVNAAAAFTIRNTAKAVTFELASTGTLENDSTAILYEITLGHTDGADLIGICDEIKTKLSSILANDYKISNITVAPAHKGKTVINIGLFAGEQPIEI